MKVRNKLVATGAAVAAISIATVGTMGLASAATSTSGTSSSNTSLVDKIAAKFNLSKTDVQAVFDQDRAEHQADMKAKQAERLAQAVTDGKLTQEQADHIKTAMAEIDSLMSSKTPDQQDDATRQQIKTKMDALRTWAEQNKIDGQYVMGGHGGPGGRGGRGPGGPEASSSSSTSTSTDSSSTN